jgi:hypothetical protein
MDFSVIDTGKSGADAVEKSTGTTIEDTDSSMPITLQ